MEELAKYSGVPVWNGLTDAFHPTQMLADLLTIEEKFGTLKGLRFTYMGDARNNMGNSLMIACAKMGLHFTACAPKELFPAQELVEAAKLDGMGYFKIFWRIMVPLSVPALFAQGILGFIGGYNDYFGPYLYLHEPNWYTLQLALASFKGTYSYNIPTVMAGAIVALIPALVIYIVAQKYFIEGIATSGMKL